MTLPFLRAALPQPLSKLSSPRGTLGLPAWLATSGLPLAFARVALFGTLAIGCGKNVGDPCQITADCGNSGTLVCDTSQPSGYCTQFGCNKNTCKDNDGKGTGPVCVLFGATPPGCTNATASTGSRFGRSFCAADCIDNSDCREGYVCRTGTEAPWYGTVLEDNVSRMSCLPAPITLRASVTPVDEAVCHDAVAAAPQPDAAAPTPDAATSDAGSNDAGTRNDSGSDAASSDASAADQ